MSTILDPPPWETRLLAACLGASAVLHGVVLAVAPYMRHAHELEPPRVLSVLLPVPARVEEPAAVAPEPPAPPPPAKQPPRHAPARARTPPVEAPAPAPLTTAPAVADPAAKDEPPAVAPAPAPAAAPSVAVAPREPVSPPDFRAAYLRNPPPGYPAAARRNGEEGTVMLRVLVSTDGAPREVVLERSSGSSSLDAAALATVKTWRFTPARRAGEAQEAWVLVPIVFRLEPRG
jgi:periplasmic protein TonB